LRRPRVRLYGKRVTKDQIILEITNLLKGTSDRRPYSLSVQEVAKLLGVSRATIYKYIKQAEADQKIPKLAKNGRLELPPATQETVFRKFNYYNKITSDPLVADWMDDILTRRGGEPLKSWRYRIRVLQSVCNTCNINPSELLISHRNTEKILRKYTQQYRNGKASLDTRGKKPLGLRHGVYRIVQGVRDFCAFYGMTWRRGVGGIMSQKIIDHGKYADVRLTTDELERADSFIKEMWGLDSDIYRWFWVGIESCARFNALYNMELDYTKVNGKTGKTIFVFTAYETKTEQIRGGKWYKYITRPDTQQSLELLKSRGSRRIYESNTLKPFRKDISEKLGLIYKHLGKTNRYFFTHPTHVMRHIGAHYWLEKKDYNYGIVSEIGGWNTIDELKKSYGQIPPERILEIIEE